MSGRPCIYPWEKWFSKAQNRKVTIKRSEYYCSSRSMVSMLRLQARLRGLRLSVRILPTEYIEVRVV